MKIISSISEMQSLSGSLRLKEKKIAVVPTMGSLHEGHLSLIRIAKQNADIVIATIFVNPVQFSPNEDFNKYPRNIERDIALIQKENADVVFTPSLEEIYPKNFETYVTTEKSSTVLEGKFRPTHFKGVTTIVAKLFNITKPHVAIFGQKDAQQVFIIQKMIRDLNFDIHIVVAPIVREHDGLAMSSRNVYLNVQERNDATVVFQSLQYAEQLITNGEFNTFSIKNAMKKMISSKRTVTEIDYISIANAETLDELDMILLNSKTLISLAVRLENTRLIDNIVIGN
ncbi:MAG: pantoate--beta-alanine ligase [Ignavibacteria bacterium]|nr:pantoate--beta-alanine ligase [Ignavibacteria bacterium]